MTKTLSNFQNGVLSLTLLPALLLSIMPAAAADPKAPAAPQSTPASQAADKPASEPVRNRQMEDRISDLRKRLAITDELEHHWVPVANVMRENETKMMDHISAREAKMETMSALDDLRSYRMITDEHSEGLKRLIPAFEALYENMTPAQQKVADHVFEQRQKPAK